MHILYEATYTNGKESVALYHNYDNEKALRADFETKLGAAIKADAYKAELLIAFDHTGKIIAQGSDFKDDSMDYVFSPRLVWVESTASGESNPDQSKKDSRRKLDGDYHTKKGAVLSSETITGCLLLGIDGNAIAYNDYVLNI